MSLSYVSLYIPHALYMIKGFFQGIDQKRWFCSKQYSKNLGGITNINKLIKSPVTSVIASSLPTKNNELTREPSYL